MGTRGRCYYCLRGATTRDHVVPRCLLEKPYPPNLLTIPSCRECNAGFKQDEEYFLAVMAQSGSVPTLMSKVDENRVVDRMLQKSPGLDSLIQGSLRIAEDGRGVYITPDEVRLANVARKVAFGLYCLRYTPKTLPSLGDFFALKLMHGRDDNNFIVVMTHTERFQPRRWTHIQTLKLPGHGRVQVFRLHVRPQLGLARLRPLVLYHAVSRDDLGSRQVPPPPKPQPRPSPVEAISVDHTTSDTAVSKDADGSIL